MTEAGIGDSAARFEDVVGAVLLAGDPSQSDAAQLELDGSRFRALIEALPSAVLVEDQNRRIVLANHVFMEMFRIPVPPQDLLGTDCALAIEASKHLFLDPEGYVAAVDELLAKRERMIDETVHMADGRVLKRHYLPVYRDGDYLGHMWLYRDVTENWGAEQELARSRAELAEAQRVARVGSWTWDPESDEVVWSETLRSIFGLAADEPTPTFAEHRRFYSEQTATELEALVARCLATGERFQIDYDIVLYDGTTRHLTGRGEPVRDASGRIVGLRGTAADLTEQHKIAEALRASEARDRALVEQLRQADAAKDKFISTLSHELRNPLAAITLAVDQLRQVAATDAQAWVAFEIAERQTRHLSRLVGDLLDVTRMTRDTIVLQTERVVLNELALKIAQDNQALLHSHGVRLEVRIAPGPIELLADPARLGQAIGNLLHNAAKFSVEGGTVILNVDADQAAGEAVVSVADQGRGIPAHVLPSLFQPFSQADDADRVRGLGLGLAIVKQIAELHGGSVAAQSGGAGQGATFVLRLPLLVSAGSQLGPQPAVSSAIPAAEAGSQEAALRVLLIEDDPDIQSLTALQLTQRGHQVTSVSTGSEGLLTAAQQLPDLIICDIGLPVMDGYAVARAIRGDERLRKVRLVALTGYGQPGDVERAIAAGFDQHLVKPVTAAALAKVLA